MGKVAHLTNIAAFEEWIKTRALRQQQTCPAFQINVEGIGRYKDPATKSRALVVVCAITDVKHLCTVLDQIFPAYSNFPFTPFQVMYTLDSRNQTAIYKAHKARQHSTTMLEISLPGFTDLETPTNSPNGPHPLTLRDFAFDLKDTNGDNIYVDIDNASKTDHTVMQVQANQKDVVIKAVTEWVKSNLQSTIDWDTQRQFSSSTYRLDPRSRELAHQLTEVATRLNPQNFPTLLNSKKPTGPPTAAFPTNNARVDLSKVKITPELAKQQTDDATV